MSRKLTPKSNLDNLKKEAKRWLKALRENDGEARARLERVYPNAPAEPALRHVQYALALEYGLASWRDLKSQLTGDARPRESRAELVDSFLEYACADPILANGPADHASRERAALRILTRYPEIARYNIHTAVVCGNLEEVERILKENPEAATEAGGPQRRGVIAEREKLWTPLLHLCYGRLPTAAASDNAVAIARALLDHGADPNDYFEVGTHPCRYTALCGVAGEGEDDAPPHPQKEALARLLLERGAEPYDIQLQYNTHFHGDILWYMELMYEFSVKAGRQADWDDPNWSMLDHGPYGRGARYFLGIAVAKNDLKLAEWLLARGASPNAIPPPHQKASKRTLYEEALLNGFTEMADLLARYGATAPAPVAHDETCDKCGRTMALKRGRYGQFLACTGYPECKNTSKITMTGVAALVALDGIEAFVAACFRLDRAEAQKILAEHPEYLQSPEPIFAAARRDRVDVVEFLLDLGVSIEVEDESKQRPLHEAASYDSLRVAEFLIERGAEIEPVETNWNNTPLDHAMYSDLTRMIEFLSRFTRDVFRLTRIGAIERLREVLREEPDLAKVVDDGYSPLMWLPDDETRAIEIIELLLAHGADPTLRSKEGMTAADWAIKRGLYEAAALLVP
jgi:uncharacterized protein